MSYNEFMKLIKSDRKTQDAFFANPGAFLEGNGLSLEDGISVMSASENKGAVISLMACSAQKKC